MSSNVGTIGGEERNSKTFSRGQLTVALWLLYLHVPVFFAASIADSANNDSDAVFGLFGVFIVTILIALPCLGAYLWEVEKNRDLTERARRFWLVLLVVLPQAAAVYWWKYVRVRED